MNLRYQAATGVVFQVMGKDELLARASLSAPARPGLRVDHLRVLAAYDEPSSVEDVADALYDWLSEEEVEELTEELLGAGLLTVEGLGSGREGGFGRLEAHLPMVADAARVGPYARAIAKQAPGLRVGEIGCGSGILSVLAAKAGALSVWAVDETDIFDLAQAVVAANGVGDLIQLHRGDSRAQPPPEPVELLIHELFGVDPFEEGVLSTLEDARVEWLAPGGRLLPWGLRVWAAVVGGPHWEGIAPLTARVAEAGASWGLNLDPLLAAAGRSALRRPEGGTIPTDPRAVLAGPTMLYDLDLHEVPDLSAPRTILLPGRAAGMAEALLVWFEIRFEEESLGTGPFDPPNHWGWQVLDLSVPVQASGGVCIEVAVRTVAGEEGLEIRSVEAALPSTDEGLTSA